MQRIEENFGIMMKYLKKMSDVGIPIHRYYAKFGGKVLITELKNIIRGGRQDRTFDFPLWTFKEQTILRWFTQWTF